jgi:hypothetical protein
MAPDEIRRFDGIQQQFQHFYLIVTLNKNAVE